MVQIKLSPTKFMLSNHFSIFFISLLCILSKLSMSSFIQGARTGKSTLLEAFPILVKVW